jgi:hypothetical protein
MKKGLIKKLKLKLKFAVGAMGLLILSLLVYGWIKESKMKFGLLISLLENTLGF